MMTTTDNSTSAGSGGSCGSRIGVTAVIAVLVIVATVLAALLASTKVLVRVGGSRGDGSLILGIGGINDHEDDGRTGGAGHNGQSVTTW